MNLNDNFQNVDNSKQHDFINQANIKCVTKKIDKMLNYNFLII